MNVTIEHVFCPYCDEVTELYFRLINTILFSSDESELRSGIEHLQKSAPIDKYFICGYGSHHFWVHQRRPSDTSQIFRYRVMIARF
ncbi:MAG: hypothetical protein Q4F50_07045 [Bacteroides sp.]|uniref:hypothetical protein n=1 Tax=Bacteroides sp. TaxID=29523 RepID=UPI0026DF388B|nr:hypothetical protein [Bacteroides sp.]MDO5419801.1 hypothetical protein [Bacteroides sp.]